MQFKSIILAFAASTSLVHAVAIPQETLVRNPPPPPSFTTTGLILPQHNTCLDPYLGLLTAFGLDLQHLGFAADDAVTCTACL